MFSFPATQNGLHPDSVSDSAQCANSSLEKALYTCIACARMFPGLEEHREHMRSEWHGYNLKRKILNIPPISQEQFNEFQNSDILQKKDSCDCEICDKNYKTQQALDNHLRSKLHKKLANIKANMPTTKKNNERNWKKELEEAECEEAVKRIIEEKEAAFVMPPVNLCLFCDTKSETLLDNVTHMEQQHNFELPYPEEIVDLPGLIEYLAEKMKKYNMCIYCNESSKRLFYSYKTLIDHMISCNHFIIRLEGDENYFCYYDFSEVQVMDVVIADPKEKCFSDESDSENANTILVSKDLREMTFPSGEVILSRNHAAPRIKVGPSTGPPIRVLKMNDTSIPTKDTVQGMKYANYCMVQRALEYRAPGPVIVKLGKMDRTRWLASNKSLRLRFRSQTGY